jgi:hypothetical protein
VVERRHHFRFALETFIELFSGDLDGDIASQARIAGTIDLAHAACAQLAEDFVRPQVRAGFEWHPEILLIYAALLAAGLQADSWLNRVSANALSANLKSRKAISKI